MIGAHVPERAGVTVLVLLTGGCTTTKVVGGTAPVVSGTAPVAAGTTHVVSGTAETVTLSCGTPPNRQPARAVHVYRGGKRGDSMSGQPYEVATVSADRKFTARLPAGRYCLSAGGAAPICDAELVVPAAPGSSQSVFVSHTIPNQQRCDYDVPPPMLPPPGP